ncbi:uncharacterized protein LOC103732693 [Nannospalax galili]|uniref:uncharacterized protein LOC103732693 n=1 Tax=Nannospalax galili TaxID=1026970 RepID=UPI0004ED2845|nr:uncharacterized protein LOC103732693 [Nannospalax galili]
MQYPIQPASLTLSPSHYRCWVKVNQYLHSIGGRRWLRACVGPSALPALRVLFPSGLAKGSAKGDRGGRSCLGRAERHPPPHHRAPVLWSIQLHFHFNFISGWGAGQKMGDQRPALTRISPEIARYSSARLGARSPPVSPLCRLRSLTAWPPSVPAAPDPAGEIVCTWPSSPNRDKRWHGALWVPSPQQGRARFDPKKPPLTAPSRPAGPTAEALDPGLG